MPRGGSRPGKSVGEVVDLAADVLKSSPQKQFLDTHTTD